MSNVVSSTSSSTSSTSTTFPSIIATVSSSSSNQSHSNTGAIVGGVVGGVAVIALAVCIIVWLIVRRRRGARTSGPPAATNAPEMSQPAIQPYAVPPVQHPTSPDSQAKGWNQQSAPQQRPVSMSPVPQYTPGSHFSGVGGQGAPHEASAVNARGTGNNAAELG
ncbi:C6 transcription factor [Colletotrichum kahawae]|uniref:C6 transcription factor n=1 Tax=Colletotrichum kahawae TaxID=34407 RepID=A0AAE0CYS3_COLKA|nr:C6 transcription factor [Colletotrichum kahawae]